KFSVKQTGNDVVHNCGVYIYSPKVFDFMPMGKADFHIFRDCLDQTILDRQHLQAHVVDDLLWLDVSDQESYINSTEAAMDVYKSYLEMAKTFRNILDRFHQRFETVQTPTGTALVGVDAKLGPGVEIDGFAVLSP